MVTDQRKRTQPAPQDLRPGPRQLLFAVYAWLVFVLLGIPLWLGVVLSPRLSWRWTMVRGAARLFLRLLGVPMTVRGAANLAHCTPCIIAANHASFTDPIVLAAGLPVPFIFTPTRLWARQFFSRIFMARLGSVFVGGREPSGDTDRLTALVRAGQSVVIFPEGAVHSTPGIHLFRTGAFVAAMEAGVCIVPVAIRGSRTLFRHQSWLPRWSRLDLVIQPPLSAERTDPDAVEHVKEATREAIGQWVDEPLLQG